MVYYKSVKITLNTPGLAKTIINVIVHQHGLLDSIVTNRSSFFTSKFRLLFCYFFSIKRELSTTFHFQTDSQTKWQNSTIKAYFRAFINFEQNDWAKFLPMAKFAYNNVKNSSIGHTSFKLNWGYHPCDFFEKNTNLCFKSKSTDELSAELWDLMTVCRKNFYHAQKLQKQAHDKGVKSRNYAPSDKI